MKTFQPGRRATLGAIGATFAVLLAGAPFGATNGVKL